MPKKAKHETQDAQSARFHAEVERMIAAGELSPTEADKRFENLMGNLSQKRITPPK
jgi:hypothetical protein